MVVHGGGWLLVGKDALATPVAAWFNGRGYSAYDVDYRVGQDSLVDVVAAYDYLRDRFGSHVEICAYGQSAGGQLVELLAASRPSLSCVISEAGAEDVRASATQCACRHEYCGWLSPADYLVWGDRLWEFSPVRVARFIRQPFLAAGSSFDPLIDEPAQLAEMKHARPQTQTMLLQGSEYPAGWAENFMHASVTTAALARFHRAVLELLRNSSRKSQ